MKNIKFISGLITAILFAAVLPGTSNNLYAQKDDNVTDRVEIVTDGNTRTLHENGSIELATYERVIKKSEIKFGAAATNEINYRVPVSFRQTAFERGSKFCRSKKLEWKTNLDYGEGKENRSHTTSVCKVN